MSEDFSHVKLELAGPVGELVLAQPDRRNAMTPAMGDEIPRAIAALNAASDVRAVVIRGEGKSFSAGGDFDLLEARTRDRGDDNRRSMRAFYDKFLSIRKLRVPSIAALHGHAIGAGLCFALACDLRIAASGTKLGLTFVRVGLHPGMGATHMLPRLVGHARAAELLLTGRVFDADEGLRLGLLSEVTAADALHARARELGDTIAANAPIAVAQLKDSLRQDRTLEQALDREAACQALDYATEDMKEAVAAFRNKRKPTFTGR
jgi:enoyl-CoA hydratase/carnithine racemase